jgi:ribosomal protein S18 acetylase RimI-like enzyme
MRTAPTYRRDLDLVVDAPDGTLAAFAVLWLDEANRSAEFEPIGCHPDHRRRGIAQALLLDAFGRLSDLGARHALVGTSETLGPAVGLYTSVGFELLDRHRTWEKPL